MNHLARGVYEWLDKKYGVNSRRPEHFDFMVVATRVERGDILTEICMTEDCVIVRRWVDRAWTVDRTANGIEFRYDDPKLFDKLSSVVEGDAFAERDESSQ